MVCVDLKRKKNNGNFDFNLNAFETAYAQQSILNLHILKFKTVKVYINMQETFVVFELNVQICLVKFASNSSKSIFQFVHGIGNAVGVLEKVF